MIIWSSLRVCSHTTYRICLNFIHLRLSKGILLGPLLLSMCASVWHFRATHFDQVLISVVVESLIILILGVQSRPSSCSKASSIVCILRNNFHSLSSSWIWLSSLSIPWDISLRHRNLSLLHIIWLRFLSFKSRQSWHIRSQCILSISPLIIHVCLPFLIKISRLIVLHLLRIGLHRDRLILLHHILPLRKHSSILRLYFDIIHIVTRICRIKGSSRSRGIFLLLLEGFLIKLVQIWIGGRNTGYPSHIWFVFDKSVSILRILLIFVLIDTLPVSLNRVYSILLASKRPCILWRR